MQLKYKYLNNSRFSFLGVFQIPPEDKTSAVGFVKFIILILTLQGILFQTSCNKLVEVDPPVNSTNAANVYTNDATAAAVLTGIYTNMSRNNLSVFNDGGFTSMYLYPSLSTDELTLYDNSSLRYSG